MWDQLLKETPKKEVREPALPPRKVGRPKIDAPRLPKVRKLKDRRAEFKPGTKVGMWTLDRYIAGSGGGTVASGRVDPAWACTCDCGAKREVKASNLYQGTSKGCGCAPPKRKANYSLKKYTCVSCEKTKIHREGGECAQCLNLRKAMQARHKAALKFIKEILAQQKAPH